LLLAASAAAAQSAGDEQAVREVVRRYVEARESMDEKAAAALFTEDADQLVSSGEWRRGRSDVVAGSMASSRDNRARRSIEVEQVRFLAPTVALADGRYDLTGEQTRRMRTTLLLVRTPGGWRIAAIRNMLPSGQPR
jgi:uncharacterized protein (TIGR02246 family)